MNLFKAVGDMKAMVAATPELIEAAQQYQAAAQAQQYQAAVQAQLDQPGAAQGYVNAVNAELAGEPQPGQLEPIAGVGLDRYVAIVKGVGANGHDQAILTGVALAHGVDAESWRAAMVGWGARIQADRAVGARFNALYTAA